MKYRHIIIFSIILLFQCSASELYLSNIEKALNVCHFDERFESPNLREEVKELFLRIHEMEKAHPDFIQVVTAQDSFFYAYQVIAKALYRKLYGHPKEDFEFLRFPSESFSKNKSEFFSRYPSLAFLSHEELAKRLNTTQDNLKRALFAFETQEEEDYLKLSRGEEEEDSETDDDDDLEGDDETYQLNDTTLEVSKELISVNFTMETYLPLDSALFVFLTGKSVSLDLTPDSHNEKYMRILKGIFDSTSLSEEKLTLALEKLIKNAPRSSFGIINQIFIPKKSISNCLYVSFAGGFLHQIYDSSFEEIYEEFQQNRQGNSFRTFRNFQARIIAGSLFEDPEVKILRYTLIPKEAELQYEKLVQETLNELF